MAAPNRNASRSYNIGIFTGVFNQIQASGVKESQRNCLETCCDADPLLTHPAWLLFSGWVDPVAVPPSISPLSLTIVYAYGARLASAAHGAVFIITEQITHRHPPSGGTAVSTTATFCEITHALSFLICRGGGYQLRWC